MTELNSSGRVSWSLAKKILLMVMVGVLGAAAAVLGKIVSGTEFGPWMIGAAILIALTALALLWSASAPSDTLRG